MNLTLNQKAELDALVNAFGGKSLLMETWMNDPTHKALCRKGLTRWGAGFGEMREHIATDKGIEVARRFKKDWSNIWADRQPAEELE